MPTRLTQLLGCSPTRWRRRCGGGGPRAPASMPCACTCASGLAHTRSGTIGLTRSLVHTPRALTRWPGGWRHSILQSAHDRGEQVWWANSVKLRVAVGAALTAIIVVALGLALLVRRRPCPCRAYQRRQLPHHQECGGFPVTERAGGTGVVWGGGSDGRGDGVWRCCATARPASPACAAGTGAGARRRRGAADAARATHPAACLVRACVRVLALYSLWHHLVCFALPLLHLPLPTLLVRPRHSATQRSRIRLAYSHSLSHTHTHVLKARTGRPRLAVDTHA
jgi:hypothetical protein